MNIVVRILKKPNSLGFLCKNSNFLSTLLRKVRLGARIFLNKQTEQITEIKEKYYITTDWRKYIHAFSRHFDSIFDAFSLSVREDFQKKCTYETL